MHQSIPITIIFTCCVFWIELTGHANEIENPSTFLDRENLFGDWGGTKPWLEERGIAFELLYTNEYFHNIEGGMNTPDAGEYNGLLNLDIELDTATADWWEGGTFFIQFQAHHGRGITEGHVGDYQVLSNIDADDYKQISELWYRHSFLDDRLWIKLGKQDANADFAFVEYGLEFAHSSPGFPPTIPLVTFPDPDWGVAAGVAPVDWFSINVGVYQGSPDGGRSIGNTLENLNGPMVMVEPAFHYSITNHPGHFRIGGWWNGANVEKIDILNPKPGIADDSSGFYITLDQAIWKEHPEEEDDQGIGMFAQYAWAPENRWDVGHYYGGGLQWIGALPTRDTDIMGIGAFHVEFSDEAGLPDGGETAIELFYTYQLFGWMTIRPDIQYITNPGGAGNKDALALGVRWEIIF